MKYIILTSGEITPATIITESKNVCVVEYYTLFGHHRTLRVKSEIYGSKTKAKNNLK